MNFLFAENPRRSAIAHAVIRIVTGVIFTVHGYQKLFVMGFGGVSGAFAHMGAPLPGVSGPLFAVCEFFLGIAAILGLLTRVGALWFILDMLGAIVLVHLKNGWSGKGGLEFPVLLLAASIVVFLAGPGCFAVDNQISSRRNGPPSA
jgi:putative oxidoreductase